MELTFTDPDSLPEAESAAGTAANESAEFGAAITRESLGAGLLFLERRCLWQADKQIIPIVTAHTVILLLM